MAGVVSSGVVGGWVGGREREELDIACIGVLLWILLKG